MPVFKVAKEVELSEDLEADALYFIKAPGDTSFKMHLTNNQGVPFPLEATAAALRFDFPIPSTEWHVNHNLNRRPSVNIIIDNERWESAVNYPDANNLVVVFNRPRGGTVEIV